MQKTFKKNMVGFIQTDKAFFVQSMVAKKKLQFLDQLYGKLNEKETISDKKIKKSFRLNFSSFLHKLEN